MLLLVQDLYYALDYRIVVVVRDVFDTFDGRDHHTDQRCDGVAQ